MVCQICGEKSGYYPLCVGCNVLRESGNATKCGDCGIWRKGCNPLCLDCFLKKKHEEKKKSKDYTISMEEKEETDFRKKFPANFLTDDGHWVRSKSEQMIDNWLYHNGFAHAYERKVPIEEELYCDFFILRGNIWIEFWGSEGEKYNKRKILKQSLYQKYKKNLVELNDKDIEKLDDVMPGKLRQFLPDNFIFD